MSHADFQKQVDKFNEVMAMDSEAVEHLAQKVRALGAPTLTDEELAQWTSLHQPEGEAEGTYCQCCRRWWPCPEAKLIAALRAKTEEARKLRVEADAMGEIAREWEAKAERLRERMTEWATAMRSHRETYSLVPSRVWVDAGDFLRLESATPYSEPEWMRQERFEGQHLHADKHTDQCR